MSRTTLHVVQPNGDVIPFQEFQNAWGWAAFVWQVLCKKYDVQAPSKPGEFPMPFDEWPVLWAKHAEGEIKTEPWETNVLLSTYDNWIVKSEDFEVFARSLDRFEEEHAQSDRVCHCKAIAQTVRGLSGVQGVGFHATSVSSDPWLNRNDDTDEEWPYNIYKQDIHTFAEMVSL